MRTNVAPNAHKAGSRLTAYLPAASASSGSCLSAFKMGASRSIRSVIGTAALREGVERELERANELQASLEAVETQLAEQTRARARSAPAMLGWRAVEEARARLEQLKRQHLGRERTYLASAVRTSAQRLSSSSSELARLKTASDDSQATLADAARRAKATETAAAKMSHALALEQRACDRAQRLRRDERGVRRGRR